MLSGVTVHGGGIAACCCLKLLRDGGVPVCSLRKPPLRTPTVLVSPATQSLLGDVFRDSELWAGLPVIRQRVVLWGDSAEPVTLPHFGIAVPEAALLERLWTKIPPSASAAALDASWDIRSTSGDTRAKALEFGSRMAHLGAVQLRAGASEETCWVESLAAGWLFLLPSGERTGTLMGVGGEVKDLLAASRLIAPEIHALTSLKGEFPASPCILPELAGPGWLACGTAAMRFDPICGEGAGNAVREAILAAAAVRAIEKNSDVGGVLAHYSARLKAGFLRHLETCEQFYAVGGQSAWWAGELALIRQGLDCMRRELAQCGAPRYRLVDFTLEAIGHPELTQTGS